MEDQTRIWANSPKPSGKREACLVHIYPRGPNMGSRFTLSDGTVLLGRDDDCQIRIDDDSASRRHARLQPEPDGYLVVDLGSTNGTYVNNVRVDQYKLADGDYLRIGNCIYRFLTGGNIEMEYHEEIYRLTIIDALTEIHNKRYLLDFLGRELTCSTRYRRPLGLVMFDIDHFKAINDRFGHLCGDFTLRELAACIKGSIRKTDLLARYGGEEFALVLPETDKEGAVEMAEKLRLSVAQHPFQYEGEPFKVTISLGVTAVSGEDWLTTNEMLQQADDKLYQAKRDGRNCVVG